MRRRPAAPAEDASEDWLTTYADAITLLMAFFVMLFTIASQGEAGLDAATDAIAAEFGAREMGATGDGVAQVADAPDPTTASLESAVKAAGLGDQVSVEQHDRGLSVTFTGEVLFAPGQVALRADTLPAVQGVVNEVAAQAEAGHTIEIEGHTDDSAVAGGALRSNWDVSALRAASLATVVEAAGVPAKRVKVVGYGASLPIAQNRDVDGRPIPENQARNRRVTVVLKRP
jgi:chemotaxis protein MotB